MSLDAAVAAIASCQFGLISREQVLAMDGTDSAIRWRLRTGRWTRVFAGVYLVAGTPPSWHQKMAAVLLASGPASVASHSTAAAAFRLEGFGRATMEVTVPRSCLPAPRGVTVHRADLAPSEITTVDGIRVTAFPRMLRDLGDRMAKERFGMVVDEGVRRRLTTFAQLRSEVDGDRRGDRGVSALRAALQEIGPRAGTGDSKLEEILALALLRDGLPEPVRQFPYFSGRRKIATIDLAYPEATVAIEPGADPWHVGSRRDKDAELRNRLALDGWLLLEFTERQIRTGLRRAVADVRTALMRRNPALIAKRRRFSEDSPS